MVEVAGIEPASRNKAKAESTCLAVFKSRYREGKTVKPDSQANLKVFGRYYRYLPSIAVIYVVHLNALTAKQTGT